MAPTKRTYYSYELKNEVIQMVKSGAKRSDVVKKYGINVQLLAKWIKNTDTIVAKASGNKGKVEKAKQSCSSMKGSSLKKLVDRSTKDDLSLLGISSPLSKDSMDKQLMPLLAAQVMTLHRGQDDDHSSVQSLIKWFSLLPERTTT